MVTALLALWLAAPAQGSDEVADALGAVRAPWYDARSDAPRPLWPRDQAPDSQARGGAPGGTGSMAGAASLGTYLAISLLVAGLLAVIGLLAWNLRGLSRPPVAVKAPRRAPGKAARFGAAELPDGLGAGPEDPRLLAERLRASGDLAGAITALFAHLLILLDRRGLSPLAPGRTPRQLVRAVGDREVRRGIEPTLLLFEAAYYGARDPDPAAFRAAWAAAEGAERRLGGRPAA